MMNYLSTDIINVGILIIADVTMHKHPVVFKSLLVTCIGLQKICLYMYIEEDAGFKIL